MDNTSTLEPGVHVIPPPRPHSPATAGIRLNHLMIRITDPKKSLRFYNDFLGMHTVFTLNTGGWTIYYLGPRDVGMHNLGVSCGLLELYHIPQGPKAYRNGNENGGEGFGHLGFTVPDVALTLQRASDFGYQIIKPLGESETSQYGVPKFIKGEDVSEGYRYVFRQLAFVQDPDGYWVELVPQYVKPAPKEAIQDHKQEKPSSSSHL